MQPKLISQIFSKYRTGALDCTLLSHLRQASAIMCWRLGQGAPSLAQLEQVLLFLILQDGKEPRLHHSESEDTLNHDWARMLLW